jgi:hypothetical protein
VVNVAPIPLLTLFTNPLNADSDADGVSDGTEIGRNAPEGTDKDPEAFVSDAEPGTTTDPLDPDTDSDGLDDGFEDANANGAVENTIGGTGTSGSGESDPNDADTDGDGPEDGTEAGLGTSPVDTDTDDGGVDDGTEVNVVGTDPLDPSDDGPIFADGFGSRDLATWSSAVGTP